MQPVVIGVVLADDKVRVPVVPLRAVHMVNFGPWRQRMSECVSSHEDMLTNRASVGLLLPVVSRVDTLGFVAGDETTRLALNHARTWI